MLNLIKMEISRMLKSKCTYVILILTIFFSLINPAMLKITLVLMDNSPEVKQAYTETLEEVEDSENVGVGVNAYGSSKYYDDEYEFTITDMSEEMINGGFILLFVLIFTVIFSSGEIKNGFTKNLLGQIYDRKRLVFANCFIAILMTIAMILISILVTALAGAVLFENVKMGDLGIFAEYLLTQILLHISFMFLMILFTYMLSSSAFAMTTGICLGSGMGTLIYSLISMIVNKVFKPETDFDLSQYTLTGNMLTVRQASEQSDVTRALIVAVSFGIVLLFLSCFVVKKKDLR